MSVTPRCKVLLQVLANLEGQMADAAALMGELQDGTPDHEAAGEWLAESTAEAARVSKLLADLSER
jgi:hypothetical protein